jgi:hypothetical protein
MIDLVVGAAQGFNGRQIRPFLKSLRDNGYEGRVILFADKGAAREAAQWDVEVLPCPPVKVLPHAERFLWIHKKITNLDWDPRGIFLADTRDIIFQGNAANLPSYGLHAFEEDPCMTIGSCPYNSEWMELGYGKPGLDATRDQSIICVGTICGDPLGVGRHLQRLCIDLEKLQPKTRKPQDQSCHNYIIRSTPPTQKTVWANDNPWVYTVGYVGHPVRDTIRFNDEGIMNGNGLYPLVVHQWDRHPSLKEFVEERYS